jgi:hypothetical protein
MFRNVKSEWIEMEKKMEIEEKWNLIGIGVADEENLKRVMETILL